MVELSNKATGDTLTADEWDNRAKEEENVVKAVDNQALDGSKDTQLVNSIDRLTKSNLYFASGANNYSASPRNGLNVNCDLRDGMLLNVRFDSDNTGAVTLDIDGTARSVKNYDGSDLEEGYILADIVEPLFFDGSNFKLANKKFKVWKEKVFDITTHADIEPYIAWDTTLGSTPNYDELKLNISRKDNTVFINGALYVSNMAYDSESDDLVLFTIDLYQFLIDNGLWDADILNDNYNSSVFYMNDASSDQPNASAILAYFSKDNTSNPNKLSFIWTDSPYKGSNTVMEKMKIYFNINAIVEDN